jgi:DNA-binding MarR family transcriptional regulator
MTSPGVDTIAVWERLLRFQRSSIAEMNRSLVTTVGHSLDEYDVLHQVHRNHDPIRMGELADRLLVANSSCTRLVAKLVQSGHLVRRPGDVDRREVLVALTDAGRKLHRRMAARHTRDIERLLGGILTVEAAHALDAMLPRTK